MWAYDDGQPIPYRNNYKVWVLAFWQLQVGGENCFLYIYIYIVYELYVFIFFSFFFLGGGYVRKAVYESLFCLMFVNKLFRKRTGDS